MNFLHLKTNHVYKIVGFTCIEASNTIGVLYEPYSGGTVWMRPASEFFDGRFAPFHGDDDHTTPEDFDELPDSYYSGSGHALDLSDDHLSDVVSDAVAKFQRSETRPVNMPPPMRPAGVEITHGDDDPNVDYSTRAEPMAEDTPATYQGEAE